MFFDLTSLEPDKLSRWLSVVGINLDQKFIISGILFAIACIITYYVIKFIIKLIYWLFSIPTRTWQKQYIKNQLSNYDYYTKEKNYKLFVETKFTVTPPNDLPDPSMKEFEEEGKSLMDFYMNKVFVSRNTSECLYYILAGSGMGKTTFSIHLFVEYIKKYKEKTLPFDVRLLSLAHQNVIEQINSIDNKQNTILLLDALDENSDAANEFETFKNKLEEVIEPFRIVVITCRTQFFKTQKEEPEESNLLSYDKEKGFKKYIRHYIAPFTDEDINLYLKKKYNKKKDRKKALNIISKCRTLMVRPLLLSYIDDLVDSNLTEKSYTIPQLYKVLIDKWIQREVNILKPESIREDMKEKLFAFSCDLALNIFENRRRRGDWHINREDYDKFLIEKGYNNVAYSFDGRSLINRDSAGNIKFAHKSFFEYFIALHKFKYPTFRISREGMDVARSFYRFMVEDDITTYSMEKIFTLECPVPVNLQSITSVDKEDVLHIYKKSSYDYGRIFQLYADGYVGSLLYTLHVPAELIDDQLINCLIDSNIRVIHVENYMNTDLSSLLDIPSLSYLNIESKYSSISLSENFIDKARLREITVVLGEEVYTISKDPTAYIPFSLRFFQLREKQRNKMFRILNDGKNHSFYVK